MFQQISMKNEIVRMAEVMADGGCQPGFITSQDSLGSAVLKTFTGEEALGKRQ
jgi:hypothetical protein